MTRIGNRAVIALLLLGGALAPLTGARGQQTSDIRGAVRHRDGRAMADIPVALEVHDGRQVLQRLDAVTDAAGAAVFRDVRASDGNVARMSAEYGGVTYHSEPVVLGSGSAPDLAVTVSEVTSEGRPLHLDTLHIIVQADDPTRLQVLEFATVSNAGETAWAGGPPLRDGTPAGLQIPIPSTALEVQPAPFPTAADALPAAAMEVGDGQVLDPRPVPPGGRQVALTYVLESGDEPAELRLTLPYPTQSVSVLVGGAAAEALDLEDTSLTRGDPQQIGEQRYEMFTAEALSPGAEVVLGLGRRGAAVSAAAWALIGLGITLGLAVVGSFQALRPGPDPAEIRDRVLQRIAALDLEHEDGALDTAEYHRRRAEEVERLLVLQSRLGDSGAAKPDEPAAADE